MPTTVSWSPSSSSRLGGTSRTCGSTPCSTDATTRPHPLLDGRATPPRSALAFMQDLERRLAASHPDARIGTVGGRYWAMDRDQRWDRTAKGYDAIIHGVGKHAASATAAIEEAYGRGENDEFVA